MEQSQQLKTQQVVEAIAQRGKVARQKDLVARGHTLWNLRQAVKAGLIERVAPGYYALPDAEPLDIHLARHQARKTCFTKAEELGLWVLNPPTEPHVATAHGRPVPGCVAHRVQGGQRLMDILRQCVRCGTELQALAVFESAVVLKFCTLAQLKGEFRGPGDAAARAIIAMIDPQSQSIVETAARYHLKKAGFNVQGQASVRGVGHLDLLVEGVLGVEVDGERYHNTPEGWAEDLRRDNMLVVQGVWKLRIPAAMVLHHPEMMVHMMNMALERVSRRR